jgi:phosphate transport system protein
MSGEGIETRRSFHASLAGIREDIIRLAATVVDLVPRGTAILLDDDLEGANLLVQADDELDARSIDLEERCYQLLALQQPMAGDLRHIVAAVRMIGEIERSADLVVNICKAARRLHGHELDPKLRGIITRMGEQAQHLFARAIDAYADADDALAAAIDDMDNLLDDLQREFIQAIFECHAAHKIDLQVAVQLAVVARFYERIGDHAVNMGQRVRYMVTGWLPEHTGAARFRVRRMDDSARDSSAGEHPGS